MRGYARLVERAAEHSFYREMARFLGRASPRRRSPCCGCVSKTSDQGERGGAEARSQGGVQSRTSRCAARRGGAIPLRELEKLTPAGAGSQHRDCRERPCPRCSISIPSLPSVLRRRAPGGLRLGGARPPVEPQRHARRARLAQPALVAAGRKPRMMGHARHRRRVPAGAGLRRSGAAFHPEPQPGRCAADAGRRPGRADALSPGLFGVRVDPILDTLSELRPHARRTGAGGRMPDAALRLSPLRVPALTLDTNAGHSRRNLLSRGRRQRARARRTCTRWILPTCPRTRHSTAASSSPRPARDKRGRCWRQAPPACWSAKRRCATRTSSKSLSREFGRERIGVHVPAARMQVSWSMDTVSNADFKVMRPSVCEPNWEVLMADGSRTGVHASWWIGEMMKRGAGPVMVRVDIEDDADLNLCAGLVEQCGERLWLAPLTRQPPQVSDWIEYGHARNWPSRATPTSNSDAVLALRAPADRDEQRPRETA
ncbi:MAG: hypothetical protein MZW92_46675 [Comamonadaceae bacterium]|nr:hypothetical protein [Comamonadaceae bacterium]